MCNAIDRAGRQTHVMGVVGHQSKDLLHPKKVGTLPVAGDEEVKQTNEIKMAIPLLDAIDIQGKDISTDALLTQQALARYLVEDRQAHYYFIVKGNQSGLLEDISRYFQVRQEPAFATLDHDHGRIETRQIWTSHYYYICSLDFATVGRCLSPRSWLRLEKPVLEKSAMNTGMNIRAWLVGLAAFAWAGVSLAQECDGISVTSGCTVNNTAGAACVGTAGNDVIVGTFAPDVVSGLGGNDIIDGGSGLDVICGDAGNDLLVGGAGVDDLLGGAGNDTLDSGGDDGDELTGGTGDDSLVDGNISFFNFGFNFRASTLMKGGDGNDNLSGGGGEDLIVGGAGVDKCDGGGFETDNISQCEFVIQDN